MISVHESGKAVIGKTDIETPNIEDVISSCVKKARDIWGDLPLVIEARSWDLSFGDVVDDSYVFVEPDMKRYNMAHRLIKVKINESMLLIQPIITQVIEPAGRAQPGQAFEQ